MTERTRRMFRIQVRPVSLVAQFFFFCGIFYFIIFGTHIYIYTFPRKVSLFLVSRYPSRWQKRWTMCFPCRRDPLRFNRAIRFSLYRAEQSFGVVLSARAARTSPEVEDANVNYSTEVRYHARLCIRTCVGTLYFWVIHLR